MTSHTKPVGNEEETLPPVPTKKITFQTNYNNKLLCKKFLHFDIAPKNLIPEKLLRENIIQITTADNSHPPVLVKLSDLARFPLYRLTTAISWPSHGKDPIELIDDFLKIPGITMATEMAAYFYEKIEL